MIDSLALEQPLQVARVHDLAAVLPRRRADVDDVVGLDDRGLVVLDDDRACCPRSRSRTSVSIRRRLSRWCRPIEGSSRM